MTDEKAPRGRSSSSNSIGRAVWATILSLPFPGVGHIYAGAWAVGVWIISVGLLLNAGLRASTRLFSPTPVPFFVASFMTVAALVLTLAVAADAARRAYRPNAESHRRWLKRAWPAFLTAFTLNAVRVITMPIMWHTYAIRSFSDLPTIMAGEYIVADKHIPPIHTLLNQTIVFVPPNARAAWIKRVVGLAGDIVQLKNGVLYINDHEAAREALGDFEAPGANGARVLAKLYREHLPSGGEHAIIKYSDEAYFDQSAGVDPNNTEPYTVPPDTVFVLGDSRDNSMDSRFATIGPIPVTNIVGVAKTIYWSATYARIGLAVR